MQFVKDGECVTSHTAPTETDSSGNTNNVLKPSDMFTSSAAPGSSTAAMAAAVPKEADKSANTSSGGTTAAPGAFPETPGPEPGEFSVKPIPASEGTGNPVDLKPGEKVPDPSTINSNTVQSTVHDDPELKAQDEAKTKEGEQTFSVNPIPATAGTGNPIDLKPGEKVPPPSEITSNTVNSTVKTDKASYENSDAMPGDSKPTETSGGMFGVPPVTTGMIPESSLPMGNAAPSGKDADPGVTIQSSAPDSTTAQLAGQVPLEKKQTDSSVPEVVKESQKEAHIDPEASANPTAVEEKKEVEQELLKEIKTTDATGEPAPTDAAATSATAPAATSTDETPAEEKRADRLSAPATSGPADSRDVSPMTKVPTDAGAAGEGAEKKGDPTTPTRRPGDMKDMGRRMSAAFKKMGGGGDGSSIAAATGTPDSKASRDTKGSGKEGGDKKKKRGFFGKIKDALK